MKKGSCRGVKWNKRGDWLGVGALLRSWGIILKKGTHWKWRREWEVCVEPWTFPAGVIMMTYTKFGPDRFSRFDVSWIQTDKQTTDRQAKFIYRLYRFAIFCILLKYSLKALKKCIKCFRLLSQKEIETMGYFF